MFLYNNSVKKMLSTPAELKNELTPSGEFFSYCVIFSLSSKLSDFFPKERNKRKKLPPHFFKSNSLWENRECPV